MPQGVPGDLLERWFEILPADPVADLLLTLAVLVGVCLALFALRLPGGLQFAGLILTLLVTEFFLIAQDNWIAFVIAWEVAAFLGWAIGRADAEVEPGKGTEWPVQAAGVVASILMIFGLWALSRDSGSFDLSRMRATGNGWISLVFLGAVLLKTLTLASYAWREDRQRVAWASSAFLLTGIAYLVGIYPFTRLLLGSFGDLAFIEWREATVWIGLGGAVISALAALGEDDVKRAISYGALGQLLVIFAALALPNATGLGGILVALLGYSFSVAVLYLAYGVVELATGERRLSAVSGAGSHLPGVGGLALVAGLSLAGVPPLGAFAGQLILIATFARLESPGPAILYAATIILTALYLLRLFRGVFLGEPTHSEVWQRSRFTTLGLTLMAFFMVVFGTLPFWSEGVFLSIVAHLMR